jgi:hypothetical protein
MLDDAIKSAMQGNIVSEPPVSGDMKLEVRKLPPPEIIHNVNRVQMECDPVGFLMDIVKGTPIETHVVDSNGEFISEIMMPNLKQRIDAAKFLSRMIQPAKQVHHAHLHGDGDDWDKIVGNAARKSR